MEKNERRESEKGTKERDFEDDYYMHNIVLFTAGAAVLMACLKRAVVVFLSEEWRAWVFVVLNLVLLAILFTSTLSTSNDNESHRNDNAGATKIERNKKTRRQRSKYGWSEEQVTKRHESEDEECRKSSGRSSTSGGNEEALSREDPVEAPKLSKEELNEEQRLLLSSLDSIWFRMRENVENTCSKKGRKELSVSGFKLVQDDLTCYSSAHNRSTISCPLTHFFLFLVGSSDFV